VLLDAGLPAARLIFVFVLVTARSAKLADPAGSKKAVADFDRKIVA
jgi:hypothetical protein